MPNPASRLAGARRTQIESLEDRLLMSADPLGGLLGGTVTHHAIVDDEPEVVQHTADPMPDFWLDPVSESVGVIENEFGEIEQTLASAHGVTGWDDVSADYGFTGAGQTVAVIDSGIAYDHYALGGGYGSDYRVVGGWDFTGENDADAYDDGPEGSHGTHVAGIIGSDDATHSGVAPGVDLVSLRVFDDAGNGYFSWVEDALQWVYDNRDAFENPITTVNLSLGTNWNSATVPSWANLEDEFAQLEQAGIFISVSAGNSFTDYNSPGLSYPAASPYVVPVMSIDDSGALSYFSQRHETAIAAPGRWIYSTIPDYAGNNNGVADDWANFSGTSMAAPYVAGASVLVREAMEFVGYTGIDQDTIYDHLLATADTIHDSATGLDYAQLNLEAAIDALMPADDYGSSEADAYDLGTVTDLSTNSLSSMSGVISTLDDGDYFTFTAGVTGTVTFTATSTTHELQAAWAGMGGDGWMGADGLSYTMDVAAGQQYTVAISSSEGLGYYDLSVSAEAVFTYTDWGALNGQATHSSLTVDGQVWHRVVAGQDGYLTAEALLDAGSVDLGLYDASLSLIATETTDRVDYYAAAGEELFLRIDGAAEGFDLRLTNLVSVDGPSVNVDGATGDDAFVFTSGANEHTVTINGVAYSFDASTHTHFELDGGAGADSLSHAGSTANEEFVIRVGTMTVTSATTSFKAEGFEEVDASGGGGYDTAVFHDTAGDDTYATWSDRSILYGEGFSNEAHGFDRTYAYSTGGDDRAFFYDTDGDDTYVGWSDRAIMYGDGYSNETHGFVRNYAYATTGEDRAFFHDTEGDDTYIGRSDRAKLYGDGFMNEAHGFARTYAYSSTGEDRAFFYDTEAADTYIGWSDRARMYGDGYYNEAWGFNRSFAYASTGDDRAIFFDTAGDDTFIGWSHRARLYGDGYYNEAYGFGRSFAYATSGDDRAIFYDTDGDDTYIGRSDKARMYGDDYANEAFDFARTLAYSTSGADRAYFFDSVTDDTYIGWSDRARMYGSGYFNEVYGFGNTHASSDFGADRAVLKGSSGNDHLAVLGWGAYAEGDGYRNDAEGFATVIAESDGEGDDTSDIVTVDYLFEITGDWS